MPDEISSALERIREKLDRLRRLDTLFSVFGSGSHRYLMGQRLTNADLKSLERQLGATLPLDYRQFLMEVGTEERGRIPARLRLTAKIQRTLLLYTTSRGGLNGKTPSIQQSGK